MVNVRLEEDELTAQPHLFSIQLKPLVRAKLAIIREVRVRQQLLGTVEFVVVFRDPAIRALEFHSFRSQEWLATFEQHHLKTVGDLSVRNKNILSWYKWTIASVTALMAALVLVIMLGALLARMR
jgi:hypothetical protein